jgi:hypothetical protein
MLQHGISNTVYIDAEIADMADRISELRTRIADLEEHMRTLRTHRSAQSLLCRLPTDAIESPRSWRLASRRLECEYYIVAREPIRGGPQGANAQTIRHYGVHGGHHKVC